MLEGMNGGELVMKGCPCFQFRLLLLRVLFMPHARKEEVPLILIS